MRPTLKLEGNLSQGLIISPLLTQAFEVLKMGSEELFDHIESILESNPLITVYGQSKGIDGSIARYEVSLYEHLMTQARLVFKDLTQAEAIIGNLDQKGFYTEPVIDEDALKIIQSFDPPGIAAKDVRDSLLIQLRMNGHSNSLAYEIINNHYLDFLHGRASKISKALKHSLAEVQKEIQTKIKPLDPFPGYRFSLGPSTVPSVDLVIHEEVEINTPLPLFSLKEEYSLFSHTPFYRAYLSEAKWLIRSVKRRNQILQLIGSFLKKTQKSFLLGEGALIPMTMKEAALALNISEASLTRAVSNKLISCPLGIIPLRSFFSTNQKAKELLATLINNENKASPLSDQKLAESMNIARRTATKYRLELKIPNAAHRKIKALDETKGAVYAKPQPKKKNH
jgi:RNA polymerase sigma-54 factor